MRTRQGRRNLTAWGKHYINKQSMAAIGVSAAVLPVLGMTPVKTMEALAGAAQGFMRMEGEAHIPHFFSMECLKGGLVSIAIGALVYLLVIRTVFLRKQEGGRQHLCGRLAEMAGPGEPGVPSADPAGAAVYRDLCVPDRGFAGRRPGGGCLGRRCIGTGRSPTVRGRCRKWTRPSGSCWIKARRT